MTFCYGLHLMITRITPLLSLLFTITLFSQENKTEKVLRINLLNPAIELELPTSNTTTLSLSTGIGYSVSYPHTSDIAGTGFITSFNPFFEAQEKWFYNFKKRKKNKRTISHNSGNFISSRLLVRTPSLFGSSNGTNVLDFAFGPT